MKIKRFLVATLMVLSVFIIAMFVTNGQSVYAEPIVEENQSTEVVDTTTTDTAIEEEQQPAIETELTEEEVEKIKDYISKGIEGLVVITTGDYNAIKAFGIGVVGTECAFVIVLAIVVIRLLFKRGVQSEAHERAMNKLNKENQAKALETEKRIDEKMANLEKLVMKKLANDDSKIKADAEAKAQEIDAKIGAALKNINL